MLANLRDTFHKRWFKVAWNLVMIFVGLELIEYAYATQYYFSAHRLEQDLTVLVAMYIAFIAGLFPNYASTIADAFAGVNIRRPREIGAVLLFVLVTFLLSAAVIYASLVLV